jgi:hypothetical protein
MESLTTEKGSDSLLEEWGEAIASMGLLYKPGLDNGKRP